MVTWLMLVGATMDTTSGGSTSGGFSIAVVEVFQSIVRIPGPIHDGFISLVTWVSEHILIKLFSRNYGKLVRVLEMLT